MSARRQPSHNMFTILRACECACVYATTVSAHSLCALFVYDALFYRFTYFILFAISVAHSHTCMRTQPSSVCCENDTHAHHQQPRAGKIMGAISYVRHTFCALAHSATSDYDYDANVRTCANVRACGIHYNMRNVAFLCAIVICT